MSYPLWYTRRMKIKMNKTQAIEEQLADAREASHADTRYAEWLHELDERCWLDAVYEDNWKEFIR